MIQLEGKYAIDFYDVKKYIEKGAKPSEKLNEALENLHAIYLEAQEKETPVSEIHEGTAKDYAKEIVEGLPHIAPEKRRIIKRVVAAVLAVAFVLAAYFTSDWYYMQIGGFNYKMRYSDKFWGGAHGGYEDETYTAYVSVGDDGNITQDEKLAEIGIYFENGGAAKGSDEFFSVMMRSKTQKLSPTSYYVRVPGFSFSSGEFYWITGKKGEITAEVGGLPFVGEVERIDGTGYDMIYDIYFRASDENADYSGIAAKINSGETIKIVFKDVHYYSWNYKGLKDILLVEGYFPFFGDYKYRPVNEDLYAEDEKKEPDVFYYLTTSDGKAQAVIHTEYNEELGGQELIWDSVPRKLDESLEYVESGRPFLDDNGMVCVEITEVFADGTIKTETVKAEKKTKFVYSEYEEYSESKMFLAKIEAFRDEEGRFTKITGYGTGTTEYIYNENHEPIYNMAGKEAEFSITEEGDVVVTIYYYSYDNPEEILSETIVIYHKKY